MQRARIKAIISLLVVIVWIIFSFKLFGYLQRENLSGFYIGKDIEDIYDHRLVFHTGKVVSFSYFEDKILLVTFGYINCPDVCPTTLALLSKIYNAASPELRSRLQVVFISVDPKRDTPERLGKFVTYFNKDFVGLTGSPEEIKAVSEEFGVNYFKEKEPTVKGYTVGHNTSVYLVDNKNKKILIKFPQSVLRDIHKVLKDIKSVI